MHMTSGIYKIINIETQNYYIGSSINIEIRWKKHVYDLNRGKHDNIFLQRSWNKYGREKFTFQTILDCDGYCRKDLLNIEQCYLDNLDVLAYNLSKHSSGGDNLTNHPNREDIIRKIREAVIKTYENMSNEKKDLFRTSKLGDNNPMFGKTHSKKIRDIISQKNKSYYLLNKSHRTNKTLEEMFGAAKAREIKNKLSEFAKLRIKDKNPFYGKHHSKETKAKLKQAHTGKYYGSQNLPIIIDDIIYFSLLKASKALNIPICTIRWRTLSKNKKFTNYRYATEADLVTGVDECLDSLKVVS